MRKATREELAIQVVKLEQEVLTVLRRGDSFRAERDALRDENGGLHIKLETAERRAGFLEASLARSAGYIAGVIDLMAAYGHKFPRHDATFTSQVVDTGLSVDEIKEKLYGR